MAKERERENDIPPLAQMSAHGVLTSQHADSHLELLLVKAQQIYVQHALRTLRFWCRVEESVLNLKTDTGQDGEQEI